MEISSKQLVSFLAGMFCTGFIFCALIFIYFIATFSLAGQSLTEKENRDLFCFVSLLLIASTTLYIVILRVRNHKPFSGAGISVPLLFAIYGLIRLGIVNFENADYILRFEKMTWLEDGSKPFNMATTMAKKNLLIGKTRSQIIATLGEGESDFRDNGKGYIFYSTDKASWELRILFSDDKVKEAFLYEEGLSL